VKNTVCTQGSSALARPSVLHCSLLFSCFVVAASAGAADDLGDLEQQAFRAAVQRVAPSVVRIETIGGLERVGEVTSVRDRRPGW